MEWNQMRQNRDLYRRARTGERIFWVVVGGAAESNWGQGELRGWLEISGYDFGQFIEGGGFAEEFVAAGGEASVGNVGLFAAGDCDDRGKKPHAAHLEGGLNSVHDRHLHVGEDDLEFKAVAGGDAENIDRFGSVLGDGDLAAQSAEGNADGARICGHIIHDESAPGFGSTIHKRSTEGQEPGQSAMQVISEMRRKIDMGTCT